jgi:V-ATPase subunit C
MIIRDGRCQGVIEQRCAREADAAVHRPVQMFELAVATDDTEEVRVEGMAPETYLERFAWDEAKYPPRRPLNETVSAITDIVQQLEDGLKVGPPRCRRGGQVWCGC